MFKQLSDVPTTIFVLEEMFDRIGSGKRRYKCALQELIAAQSMQSDEIRTDEQDDEVDDWVSGRGPVRKFLIAVINSNVDFVSQLMETGKGGINEEESLFAFGVTKELTYKSYAELNNDDEDESGWN